MQHGNYWLQKEESVLCCRLRSEVGISLLAVGSIAIAIALFLFFVHFIFSAFYKVLRVLLELCNICARHNRDREVFYKSCEILHFMKIFYRKCYFF